MNVSPKLEAFILHFGEMGNRWGINRTVGQIYALLIVSPKPLHAEQICEALSFSRSNVSSGLKELQSWNLVKAQHLDGDRKEYFSAPEDPLVIARTLLEERRKREIDPTLHFLKQALENQAKGEDERYAQHKMEQIYTLILAVTQWTEEIQSLSIDNLHALMKLGSGVAKLVALKDKLLKK